MLAASGMSMEEIFLGQLGQFHRLALALCGDHYAAEQALAHAYERARDADYVKPGWHAHWMKHCLIKSCLESIATPKAEDSLGAPHWSDSLPAPFRIPLPRIIFVLRIWEGIPLMDVCRYISITRAHVETVLLDTWEQIQIRPECLTEFVTALTFQAGRRL